MYGYGESSSKKDIFQPHPKMELFLTGTEFDLFCSLRSLYVYHYHHVKQMERILATRTPTWLSTPDI